MESRQEAELKSHRPKRAQLTMSKWGGGVPRRTNVFLNPEQSGELCACPCVLYDKFGFDMKGLSMEASIEEEELDASVAYVASLLAEEAPNIKLVVGGSMGAATSLYCAICFAHGRFGENVKLDAVVACSGWFPITKFEI